MIRSMKSEGAELAVLKRLDAICEEFESAMKDGGQPRIEDYLQSSTIGIDRSSLFRELLYIEVEMLPHKRSESEASDYCRRFPEFRTQIEAVFCAAAGLSITVQGITPGSTTDPGRPAPTKIGSFEVLRELGRGGMGVVYLAKHLRLQRLVALKVIENGTTSANLLSQFQNEAKLVARLQHPHIVQIFNVGKSKGRPFLVLEYVEGISLADKLARGRQSIPDAARLVELVARAVHAAHLKGVVHRDLKPANILLAGDPQSPLSQSIPKVADFGLAKELCEQTTGGPNAGGPSANRSAVVGTPRYMSPEQALGQKTGPATDIFSLGIIFYEMITGQHPFPANSIPGILKSICGEEPVSPCRLDRRCPRDIESICLKCLEKNPRSRYPSALALAEDIYRFLADEPVLARPVGPTVRSGRWARRNPLVAGLIAAVFVALLAGVTSASYFAVQATDRAHSASQAHLKSEWQLYACEMCLTQRELERGMAAKANMILDRCRSDFRGFEFGYLKTFGPRSQVLVNTGFRNHCAAAFLADGKLVFAANDGTISTWNPDRDQAKLVWSGTKKLVKSAAFSADGRALATSHDNGVIQIARWQTDGWKLQRPLHHTGSSPPCLAIGADNRLLAVAGQRMQIWNLASGKQQISFDIPSAPARALAFHPQGDRIFLSCDDGPIRVFSLLTGKELLALSGHTGPVHALAVSSNGRRLASAGADSLVKLWEADRGQDLLTLDVPAGRVASLNFDSGGCRLAAIAEDGPARIWSAVQP